MNNDNKKILKSMVVLWIIIILYILAYFYIPAVQNFIEGIKNFTTQWAKEETSIYWLLFLSFFMSFLGSASVGIPIPFPLVLMGFGELIFNARLEAVGSFDAVMIDGIFWGQMLGCVFLGGLGCAFGESTSWLIGRGMKGVGDRKEKKDTGVMHNMDGLSKIISKNPRMIPLIIFLFALTPLPDDVLFVPLGLINYNFFLSVVFGWLGKSFTTFFYIFYPVLINLGVLASGGNITDSNILVETLILGISVSLIIGLMMYDWNKLLPKIEEFEKKRLLKKELKMKQKVK